MAGALAGKVSLVNIHTAQSTTLAHELRSDQSMPRNLALDFSPLLDLLKLPMLGGQARFDQILGALLDPHDRLRSILKEVQPGAIFNLIKDFFNQRSDLAILSPTLGSFIEGQFSLALSLVATFKNLLDPRFPRAVLDAYLSYFFAIGGYVTIEEAQIASPRQLIGPPQQLGNIKSYLSAKTATRYIRDLITITVEAAGDAQYDLRDRYPQMLARLSPAQQETAKRWFKGFASMAEAGVTTAVEETVLGIAQFQTNDLIAASASTYAGVTARKATQHVFLKGFGV
jgi:hypothetical protein